MSDTMNEWGEDTRTTGTNLSVGGPRKPNKSINDVPTRPYLWMTDDEAYQREGLADGLQSNGTEPRHWGPTGVAALDGKIEDNKSEIRHNQDESQVSEKEKADLATMRGQAASQIIEPARRKAFIAAQGNAEATGKYSRVTHRRLQEEAALER